jgi:hypothetical protein
MTKRFLGLALAVPAVCLLAAAVQSAPAVKSKSTAPPADGVPVEPAEGDADKHAAYRMHSSNNLKQLALALHNYEACFGRLPQDVVGKDGKPLLSWRVLLLPFIEQDNLFKLVKMDEPWDGPTNKTLLESMPKLFASPRVTMKVTGHTVYQGFSGPGTVFERGIKPLKFADILDGTSNTIFVVEASVAVPWTKPIDLPFDPKADLPDFGKAYNGVPLVGVLDGSVRALDVTKVSPKTLKAAITRAGGEVMGPDW